MDMRRYSSSIMGAFVLFLGSMAIHGRGHVPALLAAGASGALCLQDTVDAQRLYKSMGQTSRSKIICLV